MKRLYGIAHLALLLPCLLLIVITQLTEDLVNWLYLKSI